MSLQFVFCKDLFRQVYDLILNIPWTRLFDSVASTMLEMTKKKAMRSEKLILAVIMNTNIRRSENETWKWNLSIRHPNKFVLNVSILKYEHILCVFDVLPEKKYQDMMDLYCKRFSIYMKRIRHKIYVSNESSIF